MLEFVSIVFELFASFEFVSAIDFSGTLTFNVKKFILWALQPTNDCNFAREVHVIIFMGQSTYIKQ